MRGEGPGVAGAEFTHPERPKAGGMWAGLGWPLDLQASEAGGSAESGHSWGTLRALLWGQQ